jgi:hypothetical protein
LSRSSLAYEFLGKCPQEHYAEASNTENVAAMLLAPPLKKWAS